ncbi:MAG TPA: hypothetical protein ENJ07_04920 [Gammaproteobacteria bacterium]|nr:hypothetical protein [Gammaproteobacteria bacterium]
MMNKTGVDDMLIEVISHKPKEIEENSSQGEGLIQEDINTLFFKSQYNHSDQFIWFKFGDMKCKVYMVLKRE